MSVSVFIIVLVAAVLHASWNAMVKHAGDKHLSMSAVVLGHTPFALLAMVFSPIPEMVSWPYIVLGGFLHLAYQMLLLYSYRIGDLTQVYPIARGAAPLIVTVVSVLVLGVELSGLQLAGILMIAIGIMSLVVVRRHDGSVNHKAAFMALATGCFIALYSLNDGLGARLAETAFGFFGWQVMVTDVLFVGLMMRLKPGTISKLAGSGLKLFVIGGTGSFIAYALVIWAFTQAPIALVTALRETSIVFALIIGVVFLKERLDLVKLASVALSLSGAILLRVAGQGNN